MPGITREQLVGAILLINANSLKPRIQHLKSMLALKHKQKDIDKIIQDLDSYPEWVAGKSLDDAEPSPELIDSTPISNAAKTKKVAKVKKVTKKNG